MNRTTLLAAASLLALLGTVAPAQAGAGADNCKGYIDVVPMTITTAGTWCLRADLQMTTAATGAIQIAANDVVLDCNRHGITAMAEATWGNGIHSTGTRNTTIRDCRIAGFLDGIHAEAGERHLVERNLIRGSRQVGIWMSGASHLIRRNRVLDTYNPTSAAVGIDATGDILDNVVAGVVQGGAMPNPYGIIGRGESPLVEGNVVRGLQGAGNHRGVSASATGAMIVRNHVVGSGTPGEFAAIASAAGNTYCLDNTAAGFIGFACKLEAGNHVD